MFTTLNPMSSEKVVFISKIPSLFDHLCFPIPWANILLPYGNLQKVIISLLVCSIIKQNYYAQEHTNKTTAVFTKHTKPYSLHVLLS